VTKTGSTRKETEVKEQNGDISGETSGEITTGQHEPYYISLPIRRSLDRNLEKGLAYMKIP
ncbi:6344_t:CDS:1, partial [Acaulospora colombiana]